MSQITAPPVAKPQPPAVQPLDSRALFRHSREVRIEHQGEIYRLQLTRSGKLILTK